MEKGGREMIKRESKHQKEYQVKLEKKEDDQIELQKFAVPSKSKKKEEGDYQN